MCEWARGLRGRDAAEDGDLARPASPSRCTLPITALRVMPPSSAAIWLADNPSAHSFFSVSTRSSVQVMPQSSPAVTAQRPHRIPPRVWATLSWPDAYPRYRFTLVTVRRTKCRIRRWKSYNMAGVRRKSPSTLRPHLLSVCGPCVHTYLHGCVLRGPDSSSRRHARPSRVFRRLSPAMTVLTQIRFHGAEWQNAGPARVDPGHPAAIKYLTVPPGEAAHFVSA